MTNEKWPERRTLSRGRPRLPKTSAASASATQKIAMRASRPRECILRVCRRLCLRFIRRVAAFNAPGIERSSSSSASARASPFLKSAPRRAARLTDQPMWKPRRASAAGARWPVTISASRSAPLGRLNGSSHNWRARALAQPELSDTNSGRAAPLQ